MLLYCMCVTGKVIVLKEHGLVMDILTLLHILPHILDVSCR